jgi:hypothetical protein
MNHRMTPSSLRIVFIGAFLLMAVTALAQPQQIGFNERFALSDQREAVLAELIPGTEVYFYYHCLHYQTTGKLNLARQTLDSWIATTGLTSQAQRMQTRQILLEYSTNPEANIELLEV